MTSVDPSAPMSLDRLRAIADDPTHPGLPWSETPFGLESFGTGLPFPGGGRLIPSSIILIAGVAGMGATTVALRLAFDAARGGWSGPSWQSHAPSASVDCFAGIRGAPLAGIAVRAIGGVNSATLTGLPVRFHPPADGLAGIERWVDAQPQQPPGLLLVDAIDRLEPACLDPKHTRRLAQRLEYIALCTSSVVLVTARLTRPARERRPPLPRVEDLGEWAPLHESAGSTLLLYSESYFFRRPRRPDVLEIYEVEAGNVVDHHALPCEGGVLAPLQ